MKQFFKFMFASMLGTFLSVFALFFIFFIIIAGALSSALSDLDSSSRVTAVKDNSILRLNLNRPIVDRGPEEVISFNFGGFSSVTPVGLDQIIENLEKAKEDDKIEGILLEMGFPMAGMAMLEEIRNALNDFKSSGKWVISYSELYGQGGYYLASVASEVYLHPNADAHVSFKGLNTTIPFLKGMFDKLEIEMQVLRSSNNQFKSAVEPFMQEEMSPANRMQTEVWLGSLWNNMLQGISASIGKSTDELNAIANASPVHYGQDAAHRGLITGTMYRDELTSLLKRKTETDEKDDLNFVTFTQYMRAPARKSSGKKFVPSYKKDKIAVVYASGDVVLGQGNNDNIGANAFAAAIREARLDTSVKAIVLRVNSPGGVAIAGDIIWRETVLASQAKPLVVSMGDVAASAGYMIAANATKIYAMPGTITGSIGVFGLQPNMKGFFNHKLGITFDGVKTNRHADFGEVIRPIGDEEYVLLQRSVDKTYADFINVVAEGRNMRHSYVDSIGQGRVWSGQDALGLGLIDEIGGINAAIEGAAQLAGIEDYTIRKLPRRKEPFQAFLDELRGETSDAMLRLQLGGDEVMVRQFQQLQKAKEMQGVQAILPFQLDIW